MTNCLVTKLKGVVNNNNLPVLNVIDCYLKKIDGGYNAVYLPTDKEITITIPEDVAMWFNAAKTIKTMTFTSVDPSTFSVYGDLSEKFKCKISNYWNLISAAGFGMDMKYWRYCSIPNNLDLSSNGLNFGNIEELYQKTEQTVLNITGNTDVSGSVNTLADKMYAAGRTSGSLSVYAANTKVKKDGQSFGDCIIDFTANGWSFRS